MDPPPGDAWIDSYLRLRPRWELLKDSSQTPIPIVISRVNQFDAARLDVEMSAMLKEQLVKVFSLIKGSYWNMMRNSILFLSFSYGGSLSGWISQLPGMLS